MQLMAFDVVVPGALEAVPRLQAIAEARAEWMRALHPGTADALRVLGEWNKTADVNTTGMTVFHVWWNAFQRLAPGGQDPARLMDAFVLDGEHTQPAIEALSRTARMLTNAFGAIEEPWGEVHVLRRGERIRPLAGGRSGEPVFVSGDRTFAGGKWYCTSGYGYAAVVEFGETPQAVSMSPFGASENPESPHFDDQLALIAERRFRPARFPTSSAIRFAEQAQGRTVELAARGANARMLLRCQNVMRARLETSTVPPAPPPKALDPYTPYLVPQAEAGGAPVEVGIEVRVPAELLPRKNAEALALYHVARGHGWLRVPNQQVNLQRGVLTADDRLPGAYVVFGPKRESTPPPFAVQAGDARVVPGQPKEESAEADDSLEIPADSIKGSTHDPTPQEDGTPTKQAEIAVAAPGGAIAWGRSIELPGPEPGSVVRVIASRQIGARIAVLDALPAPLPKDCSRVGRLLSLEASTPDAVERVTVRRILPEDAQDSAEGYAQYAYDDAEGWVRLEQTSFDAEKRSLTAEDTAARLYALVRMPVKDQED
jgi:hypothetical protein